MTEQPEPKEPERLELHVSFEPKPPKPKKQRRWADASLIILAGGLVGTVAHSSLVFVLVAAAGLILYAIGGPGRSKQT